MIKNKEENVKNKKIILLLILFIFIVVGCDNKDKNKIKNDKGYDSIQENGSQTNYDTSIDSNEISGGNVIE